jgi:hypothetical protein
MKTLLAVSVTAGILTTAVNANADCDRITGACYSTPSGAPTMPNLDDFERSQREAETRRLQIELELAKSRAEMNEAERIQLQTQIWEMERQREFGK